MAAVIGHTPCTLTFVLEVEAGVGDGAIAAEGQVHSVGAALDTLGQLAVLEATDQRTVAIRAVVDVQEVIVGLDAEAGGGRGGRRSRRRRKKSEIMSVGKAGRWSERNRKGFPLGTFSFLYSKKK